MKTSTIKRIAALSLSMMTAAGATAQDGKPGTPRGSGNTPPKDTPVVVTVMTVTLAEGTGCWAKIYDGHDFKGRSLLLSSAQSLPHLEFGVGYDWEGSIDSIEVGPKATLVLYEDESYGDKKRELKAGEKVPDLHRSIFSEGVESLQLICTQK